MGSRVIAVDEEEDQFDADGGDWDEEEIRHAEDSDFDVYTPQEKRFFTLFHKFAILGVLSGAVLLNLYSIHIGSEFKGHYCEQNLSQWIIGMGVLGLFVMVMQLLSWLWGLHLSRYTAARTEGQSEPMTSPGVLAGIGQFGWVVWFIIGAVRVHSVDRGHVTTTEDEGADMVGEKGCEAELFWFCFYYLYLVMGMTGFVVLFGVLSVVKDCLFGTSEEHQSLVFSMM